MLKKLEVKGSVASFLRPDHAAWIRIALHKMNPGQAIIAVVDDLKSLAAMLRCDDFSQEIRNHRLFFAAGRDWAEELAEVLRKHPGLAVPVSFIRTITTPTEIAEQMIQAAQKVFADETNRRGRLVVEMSRTRSTRAKADRTKACVIAPAQFRLWDNPGTTLSEAIQKSSALLDLSTFNPDDPTNTSPLALAQVVSDCDALVAANFSRADAAGILPDDLAVITWATLPRIPAHAAARSRDRLIVADNSWVELAIANGWPKPFVCVAGYPVQNWSGGHASGLAVIADTLPIVLRPERFELSSHRLLWEKIEHELKANPFSLDLDIHRYLGRQMERLGIAETGMDRRIFIDELIAPAYSQGLVRALVHEGLQLSIYGRGWDQISEFAACCKGEIRNQAELRSAVSRCRALVHAWPTPTPHPIQTVGAPVLKRTGSRKETFVREAKAILCAPFRAPAIAPITGELVAKLIAS
jgi:hypothetical protein